MSTLRVLIGGEYSGTIRDAFIARGHSAPRHPHSPLHSPSGERPMITDEIVDIVYMMLDGKKYNKHTVRIALEAGIPPTSGQSLQITDEMVEAGAKHYSEGGCSGLWCSLPGCPYPRAQAPAPEPLLAVKPLEWISRGKSPLGPAVVFASAFGVSRFYSITGTEGNWTLSYPGADCMTRIDSIKTQHAAREAAQADYRERAVSALATEGKP